MNDNKVSPFYRSIKMLGTGQGFFSQACLAESVMKHMQTPMGIWYVDISNTKSTPDYRYMAVELISYYTCVKRTFNAFWPKDYKHVPIICKTTGIYALTRLMGYIHNILKDKRKFEFETLKSSKEYVYEPYIKEVSWRSLILPCLEHGSASQNMVLRRYIFSISFVPLHHEA